MNVSNSKNERSLWIFARPTSLALTTGLSSTSTGKYHLCHWGILVTDTSVVDMKALLARVQGNSVAAGNVALGSLYELNRLEGNQNTVNSVRPFTVSALRAEWPSFFAEHIGMTGFCDDAILLEGLLF